MAPKSKKQHFFKKKKGKPVTEKLTEDENLADTEGSDEDHMFGLNLGDFQQSNANSGDAQSVDHNDDLDDDDQFDDDDEDDVEEALEKDDLHEQSRKRKLQENGSKVTSVKKRRKRSDRKTDRQKQPTAEEVKRLMDTENLFHSSLFRLQIEEMLQEIRIKNKRLRAFSDWFLTVEKSLKSMTKGEKFEMVDQSWLQNLGVAYPLKEIPCEAKGTFIFRPPQNVSIIGSFKAECSIGPHLNVDIAIQMPSECFQGSDNRNHIYHHKRALYLCHIIAHLKASDLISSENEYSPCFELPRASNPLIPVAVVAPACSLQGRAKVYLHIVVPETTFKLSKLGPSKNSLRSNWFFQEKEIACKVKSFHGDWFSNEQEKTDETNYATPLHNASILCDLVSEQNEFLKLETLKDCKNVKDGIILLKVWLKQRELDQGLTGFGGHLLTMLVVYLMRCRKIFPHMSSYQVARTTWIFLKGSDWSVQGGGVTLCDKVVAGAPTLTEFHDHYPVVFVDATGFYNIAAHLDAASFQRIKNESALAIEYLDDPFVNSFQVLFMKPAPFYQCFDHVLCFYDMEALDNMCFHKSSKKDMLDKILHPLRLAADHLLEVLPRALGKRVSEWGVHIPHKVSWKVEQLPGPLKGPLLLGMKLDSEHAFSILDKGPSADLPEAEEFRKFWESKSELRRFQDGSISEAVLWINDKDIPLSKKRVVNQVIIEYVLLKKLGVKPSTSTVYLAAQLESVLSLSQIIPSFSYGSGEEAALKVLSSLNSLASQLRALPDLPLDISGVQGSSAVCRFADVFPPLSSMDFVGQQITKSDQNCLLLKLGKKACQVPVWIAPIEVILHLALSGKWPDDAQAVRRVRAAFNIKIAESLRKDCGLVTQAFPNYVDVLKEGFVFRLRVAYKREPALLRRKVMPDGMITTVDCVDAEVLEKETIHIPQLTSYLHGLHVQQPAFGPAVCLAKRWLASQMIRWIHFPEEAVELLMARVFLSSQPYSPPAQPQTAFVRFLHMLSITNWHLEPLILNFNQAMDKNTISEIEKRFAKERKQLPPLFIATPVEYERSLLTRSAPTLVILTRVALLAAESLKVMLTCYHSNTALEDSVWKLIFRPSLDSFNVLIHLNSNTNPRRSQWIDADCTTKYKLRPYENIVSPKIPVVGYDPVQCYLQELEIAYGEYALFFHDIYGGNVIGIVWKPSAQQPQPFKMTHINGRKLLEESLESSPVLVVNQDAFIEDFFIIGQGLVKSIEMN